MFMAPQSLEKIRIKRVFVVIDNRPHALIAISYALYLARLIDAELIAVSQHAHISLIEDEAKEAGVKASTVLVDKFDAGHLSEMIAEHRPTLVVINYTHPLRDSLQRLIRQPMMTVKASQFSGK